MKPCAVCGTRTLYSGDPDGTSPEVCGSCQAGDARAAGHPVTVTPLGPRYLLECPPCALERRYASKSAANAAGLALDTDRWGAPVDNGPYRLWWRFLPGRHRLRVLSARQRRKRVRAIMLRPVLLPWDDLPLTENDVRWLRED